ADAANRKALSATRAGLAAGSHRGRFHPARLHPWWGAARLHLGRPGADLYGAPRHVVGELDLPFLRAPAVRHRGLLDQCRVALTPVAWRVLAPQPSRLPALRLPRPTVVGDRPVRVA